MEILYWVLGVFWVLGWISQLATVHRVLDKTGTDYPNKAVKNAVPIVLFFTWPYFYFYGKAL